MLHPQFFEMAEMIRELHPFAKISLITNGSFLKIGVARNSLPLVCAVKAHGPQSVGFFLYCNAV
jgi:hypothetical protein